MPIVEVKITQPDECAEKNPAHCAFYDAQEVRELVLNTRCALKGNLLNQLKYILRTHNCIHCGVQANQVIRLK